MFCVQCTYSVLLLTYLTLAKTENCLVSTPTMHQGSDDNSVISAHLLMRKIVHPVCVLAWLLVEIANAA